MPTHKEIERKRKRLDRMKELIRAGKLDREKFLRSQKMDPKDSRFYAWRKQAEQEIAAEDKAERERQAEVEREAQRLADNAERIKTPFNVVRDSDQTQMINVYVDLANRGIDIHNEGISINGQLLTWSQVDAMCDLVPRVDDVARKPLDAANVS